MVGFIQKCSTFAGLCQERVMLLEAYRADADNTIKQQEEQVYICKEDLNSEKKKQKIILPALAGVLGFVLGFFIIKH